MILREDVQLKFYVMKKLFVLIVLMAGIVWGAEAQSKGITFEQTKEWKKVLKKAKKEKKLILSIVTLLGAGLVRCCHHRYLPVRTWGISLMRIS